MPPLLDCRSIRKSFAGQEVLRDVSLEVPRGECVALLGPSGCGKTTLLNVIAGLLPADSGTVRVEGETIDDPIRGLRTPMRQRRFSMVFQDFSLWPHMSVAENVAFGLRMRGVDRAERRRRVDEALRRVRMERFAGRQPSALSGGQQQRVAIARAIVVEPRLLLLDEPLSALDATLREELRDEIGALIRDLGTTTILVTHDQVEALSMAHRVAVMRDGRIEQIAEPETLYREPANAFVASFVGASTLLPVGLVGTTVMLPCGTPLPQEALSGPPRRGTAMLRRESLRVVVDPGARAFAQGDGISVTILRSAFLGDRHEVTARTMGGTTLRCVGSRSAAAGQRAVLHIEPRSVRILDAEPTESGA